MKNFGNLISSRRKELKMTQKELALKLNVSDKTISKWETGTSYPEITMLSTIAKALEMNVNDFFEVEDLQEKEIDLEEHGSYDEATIIRFKNRSFITMGLAVAGYILFLVFTPIENQTVQYILIALGFGFEAAAIFNMISNAVVFRSFYREKFYIKKYDQTFFKYTASSFLFFMPFFVLTPLITHPVDAMDPLRRFERFELGYYSSTYNGIFTTVSLVVVALSYVLLIRMARISNHRIKKDPANFVLGGAAALCFVALIALVLVFGTQFLWALTFIYILVYALVLRCDYVKQ